MITGLTEWLEARETWDDSEENEKEEINGWSCPCFNLGLYVRTSNAMHDDMETVDRYSEVISLNTN